MKLFKLLCDCPFWPVNEPKHLYRIVEAGTVVRLTGAVASVLDGELEGWVHYPTGVGNGRLAEVSALELLAEVADGSL